VINRLLNKVGLQLTRYTPNPYAGSATVRTPGKKRGWALVSYILEPFAEPASGVSKTHTNYIESVTIVKTLNDMGFSVDVIDYRNQNFVPKRQYDLFISARTNFAAIVNRLNSECVKIAHLDTAHFVFNNASASARLLALRERRNIAAYSMRTIEKNWAPEHADVLSVLGNEFTLGTYAYAGKPMYPIPVPTHEVYDSPEDKNFEGISKSYIWLGSGGLVHKGLDLVLEAFADMPDYKLTVCGPVDAVYERHFRKAYASELYDCPNIDTIGWTDIASEQFRDIANRSLGLIYPSASEGQSGAVVTCMQAGLVPVVSYESGVDVEDFGLVLPACDVDTIRRTITALSAESASDLRARAVGAWNRARDRHTTDSYGIEFRAMLESVLAENAS
jgi:glycosyltransferase involved in cell wall biosynthesis